MICLYPGGGPQPNQTNHNHNHHSSLLLASNPPCCRLPNNPSYNQHHLKSSLPPSEDRCVTDLCPSLPAQDHTPSFVYIPTHNISATLNNTQLTEQYYVNSHPSTRINRQSHRLPHLDPHAWSNRAHWNSTWI